MDTLRFWRAFTLETRILCWAETWLVMEHRLVSKGSSGQEVTNAVALVKAGLYDRKTKGFVPVQTLLGEIGSDAPSPSPSADVQAFLDAEDAMRRAT